MKKLTESLIKELNEDKSLDEHTLSDIIDDLIEDEFEAVSMYKRVVNWFNLTDKEKEVLSHIAAEEEEHIKELKKLKGGNTDENN